MEVSGACGSVTNSATLTVLTNVSATALTSLTNCPGTSASFSTVASGTAPYSYVWKKDGAVLTGESGSSFATNNVTAASAGTYTVEVSGACGSVTNSATLTVLTNVSATALTSLTNCPGTSATFSTVASGTGPFSYVWKKDGVLLAGATTGSFTTNNVSAVSAGAYTVEVTGACGSVTNSAVLTVLTNVSATALTSLTNCPGTSATFTTVASGTGPFSYVWKKDGSVLAGETGSSFATNNVTAPSAGTYTVEVTGACGSVTNSAVLTVLTNVSATALTSLTNCPGTSATFNTVASGTGPFSYVWKKDGVLLAGATTGSFTTNNVSAASAGTYSVEVSGVCGSPVTNSASLTIGNAISATTLTNLSRCPGASAIFSTTAGGTGPFTYQWYTNGVILGDGGEFSGSTSDTLTINPVTAADAMTYSVLVSGLCGSAINSATLTVNAVTTTTALTSLTRCPGTSATFSTTAGGTGPFSYVWKKDGVVLAGATGSSFTTNNVSAASAGTYTVEVTGACGNPVTTSATLTINTVTSATALTSLTNCPGSSATFTTVASGTGPFAYQWYTNGVALSDGVEFSGSTSDTLTINPATAADALTYSVVVSGACNSVTNSATLTVTPDERHGADKPDQLSGHQRDLQHDRRGHRPVQLRVEEGRRCAGGRDGQQFYHQQRERGQRRHLHGGGHRRLRQRDQQCDPDGQYGDQCDAADEPDQLSGHQRNVQHVAGGTEPFSYVWKKDGVLLAGETNSNFTTNGVSAASAGIYTVEVTGGAAV